MAARGRVTCSAIIVDRAALPKKRVRKESKDGNETLSMEG